MRPSRLVETLSEAVDRLRRLGYRREFAAVAGAQLRCIGDGEEFDPTKMRIDEIVRFEGVSDPGDEAILFALSGPLGHDGLYSAAYGIDATREDVEVVAALHR